MALRRILLLLLAVPAACFPGFGTRGSNDGDGDAAADAGNDASPTPTEGGPDVDATPPEPIPVSTIVAGLTYACALRNGRAYCWGGNEEGELGRGVDGGKDSKPEPVRLEPGPTHIAGGQFFACAVLDSRAYCWGRNTERTLGTAGGNSMSPIAVPNLTADVVSIATGKYAACSIHTRGRVACWGNNYAGMLPGLMGDTVSPPKPVDSLQGARKIALGEGSGCALIDAKVHCWGRNDSFQTGQREAKDDCEGVRCVKYPAVVQGVTDAIDIAVGIYHACALERGGRVKCWGEDHYGELGPERATEGPCATAGAKCTPVPRVVLQDGAKAIHVVSNRDAAGASCALMAGGTVKCWGTAWNYVLGRGNQVPEMTNPTPAEVRRDATILTGVTELAGGNYFFCARTEANEIVCWGNDNHQKGVFGSAPNAPEATLIQGF